MEPRKQYLCQPAHLDCETAVSLVPCAFVYPAESPLPVCVDFSADDLPEASSTTTEESRERDKIQHECHLTLDSQCCELAMNSTTEFMCLKYNIMEARRGNAIATQTYNVYDTNSEIAYHSMTSP